MTATTPVRLVRNEFELQDLVARLGRDATLVERDFALMAIAASLATAHGDALCFKGGFVLRHVHGHERFSKDIDATRINPSKHKLDAGEVADAIRGAGVRGLLRLDPRAPATDSGRGLDFDSVRYSGPLARAWSRLRSATARTWSKRPRWSRSGRRTSKRTRSIEVVSGRSLPRSSGS